MYHQVYLLMSISKSNPTCLSHCPLLLFTVIPNPSQSGNYFLLIPRINSNTFLLISNTLNQVPLHHPFDASRHPIFNSKSASESELETNGFRYCTVYHLYSFISYNLPT